MIILDTNVVSELMRQAPEPAVVAWADRRSAGELFLTAVTAAELLHGVARLPAGKRRSALTEHIRGLLDTDFDGRILPFTADAAVEYAVVIAARERAGRPITVADAQIAAIARVYGATLATRNVADFAGTGVALADPWAGEGQVYPGGR
ncbi:type II toxin-antitoxin system VapC family toxin [Amycolatopsis suaedae]|uniref:Ribonuclease VapC n=1 Tax=Amycolatopsis suaedae TaxID=2510978 RepID=A0A4Q7IZM0_9PSEU|nr:type II toxin-antitoxin system VapC family toxin [Amycolatopsis suaedae]RZQ59949.1 type II toxin-antitoxin system VapC family toxin [Amycolatopsis suaedae]